MHPTPLSGDRQLIEVAKFSNHGCTDSDFIKPESLWSCFPFSLCYSSNRMIDEMEEKDNYPRGGRLSWGLNPTLMFRVFFGLDFSKNSQWPKWPKRQKSDDQVMTKIQVGINILGGFERRAPPHNLPAAVVTIPVLQFWHLHHHHHHHHDQGARQGLAGGSLCASDAQLGSGKWWFFVTDTQTHHHNVYISMFGANHIFRTIVFS